MAELDSAFNCLQSIEQRVKQKELSLPPRELDGVAWRAVVFRLGEIYVVTPLKEIREILFYPEQLSKIPGVKPWIKGLTNIRGILLPVIDLKACLGGKSIKIDKNTRMLMIHQNDIFAGLLVDEVLGIRSFTENIQEGMVCEIDWLTPFIQGIFIEKDITWMIFNIEKFAKSDLFLNILNS
ncbi:chemotaxis protein CheW [Candidatus Marithrix sp. Canyon 246]|uniref:chemotaxis protein CheW n=1 Tax=Candidatus Marithrix sp. Canyon 246 TaxID=1827136 RepID=UPI00084A0DF5|nr:chemotaxis protein CheW [Candidatus Marithrix sp. Canyon 246]